jgi:cyclopropane fatty-acyl-phospholipid synthase-like methyltransferase
MKVLGSRTRAIFAQKAKGFIFDRGNLQSVIDQREKIALEDFMGFRGQFDEHRRFQIEMLKAQGLKPDHRFLELGCGPLTAALPLIKYLDAGNYVGVDIRSSVLDMGWREIGKAELSKKNPRLIFSNCLGDDVLQRNDQFDFIYSFSVLYHLSDDILDGYFSVVSRRLNEKGACLANINEHMPNSRWLEFPFEQRTFSQYQDCASKHGLVTTNIGTCRDLGFSNDGTEGQYPILKFTRAI